MTVVGRVPPKTRAVVAAASRRQVTPQRPWEKSEALDAPHLYDLYRRLGQLRYGLNFKGNAASKIDYFVAEKTDGEPKRTGNPTAQAALDRLSGRLGEFADFVAEFCLHLDIAGEGYLVGQGEGIDEDWDVWSPVEYQEARHSQTRRSSDAVSPLGDDDFVLRIWRPDPEYRQKPDSPLRSIAAEAEQYILLRDMVTAMTQSRLPAGILIADDRITFPTEIEGETYDSFSEFLIDAMVATVQDTRSAGRIAPITVTVSGAPTEGVANALHYVDMNRDLPDWVPTLMERILRQMAIGLDLPAEILLGLADVNHWGQWLIDDSARLNHVDPLVLLILDSITRGYLWPTLEEEGVANPRNFLLWRDYSDLTSRTLTIEEALGLFDRRAISADALRRIADLGDDDAPQPDEDSAGNVELVDVDETGEQIRRGPPAIAAAATPTPLNNLADIDERLYLQLSEAAQAALDRALERAGAKIRTHVNRGSTPRHPQLAAAIDGADNMRVGQILGPGVRETLQLSDDELVPDSTFTGLARRVDTLLRRGQTDTHQQLQTLVGEIERDETVEASWRERAVTFLTSMLTGLALRRLFTADLEPDPAETGEIGDSTVPAADIWATLTYAGGGEPADTPETPRGLATGQHTEDVLTMSGLTITERVWRHGAPRIPFEPHVNLNGTRFDQWTDPRLQSPPSASWIGPYLYPGDHAGCTCQAVPVVVEVGEVA